MSAALVALKSRLDSLSFEPEDFDFHWDESDNGSPGLPMSFLSDS
jgi:hypothetical protein